MPISTRSDFHDWTPGERLSSRTAVVRTRMPGGVGGAASRGAPLSRLRILHHRALRVRVGAEHATIARLPFHGNATRSTLVEVEIVVGGHRLRRIVVTGRARDRRNKLSHVPGLSRRLARSSTSKDYTPPTDNGTSLDRDDGFGRSSILPAPASLKAPCVFHRRFWKRTCPRNPRLSLPCRPSGEVCVRHGDLGRFVAPYGVSAFSKVHPLESRDNQPCVMRGLRFLSPVARPQA